MTREGVFQQPVSSGSILRGHWMSRKFGSPSQGDFGNRSAPMKVSQASLLKLKPNSGLPKSVFERNRDGDQAERFLFFRGLEWYIVKTNLEKRREVHFCQTRKNSLQPGRGSSGPGPGKDDHRPSKRWRSRSTTLSLWSKGNGPWTTWPSMASALSATPASPLPGSFNGNHSNPS